MCCNTYNKSTGQLGLMNSLSVLPCHGSLLKLKSYSNAKFFFFLLILFSFPGTSDPDCSWTPLGNESVCNMIIMIHYICVGFCSLKAASHPLLILSLLIIEVPFIVSFQGPGNCLANSKHSISNPYNNPKWRL